MNPPNKKPALSQEQVARDHLIASARWKANILRMNDKFYHILAWSATSANQTGLFCRLVNAEVNSETTFVSDRVIKDLRTTVFFYNQTSVPFLATVQTPKADTGATT